MSFINPIKYGYITSDFGWRTHPVTGKKQSWHQGVDIARQPNTNVEILASADGIVVRTGPLSTYGNIIIIRHKINGKDMDTLYAHLKDGTIRVKVGQKVKQGEAIAIMGSTGSSTAPHLHFEIHNGFWKTGQPNAVDPENYIELYNRKETEAMRKEIESLTKKVTSLESIVNKLVTPTEKVYNRTTPSSWAKEHIDKAKALGITDGTRLDAPLTREEGIVLTMRALNKK